MNMTHDFFQVDLQDGKSKLRKNIFLGGETLLPPDLQAELPNR